MGTRASSLGKKLLLGGDVRILLGGLFLIVGLLAGRTTVVAGSAPNAAPAPPPPAVARTSPVPADTALARANEFRARAGLPPLQGDAAITTATQNHANYYALNHADPPAIANPHNEVAGKPGFTGVNFWDRLQAAGFSGNATAEVMHFLGDPRASVNGWMASVFHRQA